MSKASAPDAPTTWRWVAEERTALADRLTELDGAAWGQPSLCAGWRVRDVVGHLVWLAEGTKASVFKDVAAARRLPMTAIADVSRQHGDREPDELIDRLRAGADGRFVLPGLPPAFALGEVLTHGSDVLRGAGAPTRPADDRTRVAAATYRRVGAVFGVGSTAKVRFTATDAGWSVGPDDGPTAEGLGEAVLLALAGRPEGTEDLIGPGTDLLSR